MPSFAASFRAAELLPDPAGPSMVMIIVAPLPWFITMIVERPAIGQKLVKGIAERR